MFYIAATKKHKHLFSKETIKANIYISLSKMSSYLVKIKLNILTLLLIEKLGQLHRSRSFEC